ncbi:MAG: hypothetical protein LH467_14460 [Gemmatimonadaceae bacterium]|nr:hypothetical protein [Gemmatimonadaceae bacterium]
MEKMAEEEGAAETTLHPERPKHSSRQGGRLPSVKHRADLNYLLENGRYELVDQHHSASVFTNR